MITRTKWIPCFIFLFSLLAIENEAFAQSFSCPGALRVTRKSATKSTGENQRRWGDSSHTTVTYSFVIDPSLFELSDLLPDDKRISEGLDAGTASEELINAFSTNNILIEGTLSVTDLPETDRWGLKDSIGEREFIAKKVGDFIKIVNGVKELSAVGPGDIWFELEPIIDMDGAGLTGYPAKAKELVVSSLKVWSSFTDLTFEEVEESTGEIGQIRIAQHAFVPTNSNVLGHGAEPPGVTSDGSVRGFDLAGDMHFNSDASIGDERLFFLTALHELGHSLGLGHIVGDETAIPSPTEFLMYPIISPNTFPLTDSDKAYIQRIYGPPIPNIIGSNSEDRLLSWDYPYDPIGEVIDPATFNPTTIDPDTVSTSRAPLFTIGDFHLCTGATDPECDPIPLNPGLNIDDRDVRILNPVGRSLTNFEIQYRPFIVTTLEDRAENAQESLFDDSIEDDAGNNVVAWKRDIDTRDTINSDNAYQISDINNTGARFSRQTEFAIDSPAPVEFETLDMSMISDNLRNRFSQNNISLTVNPTVSVITTGSEWLIEDNGQQYFALKQPQDGSDPEMLLIATQICYSLPLLSSINIEATDTTKWRFKRTFNFSMPQTIEYRVLDSAGKVVEDLSFIERGEGSGVEKGYGEDPATALPADFTFQGEEFIVDLGSLSDPIFRVEYVFKRLAAFDSEDIFIDDIILENVLVEEENFISLEQLEPSFQSSVVLTNLSIGDFNVRLRSIYDIDPSDPQFSQPNRRKFSSLPLVVRASVSGNNTYVDVQFRDGVFGNSNGTNPVTFDDFQLKLKGDSPMDFSNILVTKPDEAKSVLTGGEAILRFHLPSLASQPTGAERIEISVIDPIFDSNGTALLTEVPQIITAPFVNGPVAFSLEFTPTGNGANPITLNFGRDFSATTENNDMGLDEEALNNEVFFLINNLSTTGPEKLSKDFRPVSENTSWNLVFNPNTEGDGGQLTWNVDEANPDYFLYLQEVKGDCPIGMPIDLRDSATASLTIPAAATFIILYGAPQTLEPIEIKTGWNLTSIPLVSIQSIQSIFPSLLSGPVWFWNGNIFVLVSPISPFNLKRGYWIYSETGGLSAFISGLPMLTEGIPKLNAQWNLIGPTENKTLDSSEVSLTWEWFPDDNKLDRPENGMISSNKGYWYYNFPNP